MHNNYLIISSDKVVIDLKVKEIIKKIKEKDIDVIKFDLTINTMDEVLEELNTYNFLSNIKVVILYNALFIEGDASFDKELKSINKYLDEENDNTFIMVASKQSTKKSIADLVSKLNVIEETISSDLLIKNNLEGFNMDSRTVSYLTEICHSNNEKIMTELTKLKLYKYDDPNKLITKEDIDNIVYKEYDDNVFDLVNAITSRNKSKAIELYERLSEKEDSTLIVASIASKIRMLYSIKVLRDKKKKPIEIADILGVKPAAVNISLEQCDNFSNKKLLSLLYELSQIDYVSKTTSKDLDLQFKLFLMSI